MCSTGETVRFELTGKIITTTHTLTRELLRLLEGGMDAALRVHAVEERSLQVTVTNMIPACRDFSTFTQYAHISFSNFLVALNVATLGQFTWARAAASPYSYWVVNPLEVGAGHFVEHSQPVAISDTHLDRESVQRALMLYLAFIREAEQHVREEYEKGLLHLDLAHYGVDFRREAFLNFYRSLEYAVFVRLRKGRKPRKELLAMQDALRKMGLNEEVVAELRNLYSIRGAQVGHSQKEPVPVSTEDVLKMKVTADVVVHEVFRERMASIRDDMISRAKEV